jgi:hypothetical protein
MSAGSDRGKVRLSHEVMGFVNEVLGVRERFAVGLLGESRRPHVVHGQGEGKGVPLGMGADDDLIPLRRGPCARSQGPARLGDLGEKDPGRRFIRVRGGSLGVDGQDPVLEGFANGPFANKKVPEPGGIFKCHVHSLLWVK